MKKPKATRVLIYDNNTNLSWIWSLGSKVFKRSFDIIAGVGSVRELNSFLATALEPTGRYDIQLWCHGGPGYVVFGTEVWGRSGPSMPPLPNSSIWFRSCSTLGGDEGIMFAEELLRKMNFGEVAGHAVLIGAFHSCLVGLSKLKPGAKQEGWWEKPLEKYPPEKTRSLPWLPRTVIPLRMTLPEWAFRGNGHG